MAEKKKQPRVVLFTAPACGYCSKAKRYFKQNAVRFKEVDISRDQDAARDARRMSGGTSVPVILLGSSVVVGFDRAKLDRLLKISRKNKSIEA